MSFKVQIVFLLLLSFAVIKAKYYKPYNPKTTQKPTTTTTAKPKPYYPPAQPYYPQAQPYPPAAPSKPYYPPAPTPKPYYPSYPKYTTTAHPAPEPYHFAYEANVGAPYATGLIAQEESGDTNGAVSGMYTLVDTDGRQRTVIYTADKNGFRATVETNEVAPYSENPADITVIATGTTGAPKPPAATTEAYAYPSGEQYYETGSESGY